MDDLSVPPRKTPSAESNFRELDDAFLQTQTRIWLGEVLKIRFDEQMNISDLLSDGELLFEASEAISKMLSTLSTEDTQHKVYEWKSLTSNKSTRRYMPYYNVDSFLRMCTNLGMDGIDLFTPSDVVEKRNTRKVCMCLRSLSKKAKLRDINVPDFDSVTCTLAMPTNKVECIRKSLEMSQSSSSLSAEQEVRKASRVRFWRRMSNSASAQSNHLPDDYDGAESRYVVDESYESSDYSYDAESPSILGTQVVKNEEDDQCEYLSPSKAESIGSPCSQYYSDEDLSMPSSDCQGSRISGTIPELESDINIEYKNDDLSHAPLDWGDSVKDGSRDVNEVDYVSHDEEDIDTACSHCHLTGNDMCNGYVETSIDPSKVEVDNNLELTEPPGFAIIGDFHVGEGQNLSYEETLTEEVGPDIGKSHKDISTEVSEQSSNVSKSSENSDFSDYSEYHAFKECTEVVDVGRESCSDCLFNGDASIEDVNGQLGFHKEKAPCSIDCEVQNRIYSSFIAEKLNGGDNSTDHDRHVDHGRESNALLLEVDSIIRGDIPYSLINNDKEAFGGDTNLINLLDISHEDINTKCSKDCDDVNGNPKDIDDITHVHTFSTSSCDLELEAQAQSPKNGDDTSLINHQCMKEVDKGQSGVITKQEDPSKEFPLTKPPRKFLKSFVKGTALVGIAVFLFHLRNTRRENHSEAKKQSTRLVKHGTPKPLQKNGSISSVYPAEKLHLGI